MIKYAAVVLLLLSPVFVFAAQEVTVSQEAKVGGESAPLEAVVSTEDGNVVLSDSKQEGSVPVTFTVYISPKPKPAATSSQAAAAVQSSENIQNSISSVSPQAGAATEPFFTLVDGGRQKAADALDTQIASAKGRLNPQAGAVLGAEETKNAASDPMGSFWYALWTIWFYILTILRWLVGNAGVFYPLFALLFFYTLWRVIRRARSR